MARIVGVSTSTICRELKRNSEQRGYRPKQAHIEILARRNTPSK
ncbi:MAG: hypothetical protein K0U68_05955 [Gammaproteobacteria bacterium]|nr:hypothetical protein [Gammaproteobacteria bacterium]